MLNTAECTNVLWNLFKGAENKGPFVSTDGSASFTLKQLMDVVALSSVSSQFLNGEGGEIGLMTNL